ncbi:unnamed protein product, partial [Mesorhabditis spiculigera]
MSRNGWSTTSTPGSARPVYGAQYPPLQSISGSPVKSSPITKPSPHNKFADYENSVSDAAAAVLAAHAASRDDTIMPPVSAAPTKNSKTQAMQRLAIQKEPLPSASTPTQHNQVTPSPIYPRLPEISTDDKLHPDKGKDRDAARFERLRKVLAARKNSNGGRAGSPPGEIDMERLRDDCWMGIPHKLRPTAWRLLSGYLPPNQARREITLQRKREEYWHYVEQYFHTRFDDHHNDTFRQIHIDIPRMCPLIPLFQQKLVQEMFERILYIWAIRHPASGYVQGINDLVTPFFVVFLSEFIPQHVEVGTFDVSQLPREQIELVEADSFWCVSSLLDSIQDNYTFSQPGIQRKVLQLKHLMSRVDRPLHVHLESNQVEYLQFSFRWMNNLLMREIPLRATIRLWDTYLAERNGFSQFHNYVCAAFLRTWSKQLQSEKDFQGVMILLQNLPTQSWSDREICELTADAFSLQSVFDGASRHLTSGQSSP